MAPDDAGPGAVETPIRLVGSASAAWEDAVDFKDHLEKLLDDVRRTELESEEELPRNLLAEREDAKYTTMVARAQHFYLATPPPPPGGDGRQPCQRAAHSGCIVYGVHCENEM
eukprot:jgi/Tetstr1/433943/TSEL_023120.t1